MARLLSDRDIDTLLHWSLGTDGKGGPGWLEQPARAGELVRVEVPRDSARFVGAVMTPKAWALIRSAQMYIGKVA